MIVSKHSVIFFCLLILNVTLKTTQAMPTDIEPREYEDEDEDYNFMKAEVDGLREELENDYNEINDIENIPNGLIDDVRNDLENDYVEPIENIPDERTDDTEEKIDDDYDLMSEPTELEAVFGGVEDDGFEEDVGDVLGGDEVEREDEDEIDKDISGEVEDEGEDPVDKGFGEVIEEDDEDEDQIDEGIFPEVVGEDEEAKDQVYEDPGKVVEDNEGDDNNDGYSDDIQGNVFDMGHLPVNADEEEFKQKKFPYVWLDKIKKYFKKARYYLGI